jgi:three-Cys-motif partner protein
MPDSGKPLKLDEVGDWSELKLEILKKYASAYTRILRSKRLHPIYIDGFAGAGQHVWKRTKQLIPGSPLNALNVEPPFEEFYLVDLMRERIENLKELTAGKKNVHIFNADANTVLLSEVFPKIKYETFRRALCVLDPYKLTLHWEVIKAAAALGTIEIFINFPVMDINRNVLRRRQESASEDDVKRMTLAWGDESWRDAAYRTDTTLFNEPEKQTNEALAAAFQQRLRTVAGFKYVPDPAPMRNSKGAVVYYLYFAAHQPAADNIVTGILNNYRKQGKLHG